jgi:chemotaxis protein MotB
VSSGNYDRVVKERDTLEAEREELDGRIELLRSRIQNINQELLVQGAVIQIQDTMIERQDEKIKSQTEVIVSQTEALMLAQGTYESLAAVFEPKAGAGRVTLDKEAGMLMVNLSAEVLFGTGSVELSASGREFLNEIATKLGKVPYQVVVAGYTDNVPIGGRLATRYPTNWELAAARAARVVRVLEESGIGSNRLAAVSFGENNPVAPNDTAVGRARNRRIELRLTPIVAAP